MKHPMLLHRFPFIYFYSMDYVLEREGESRSYCVLLCLPVLEFQMECMCMIASSVAWGSSSESDTKTRFKTAVNFKRHS